VNPSVNIGKFKDMLSEAQKVYRTDVAYAVAVSSAARAIEAKRAIWKIRLELREAAKEAKAKCEKAAQFTCDTASPCGTGTCRFVQGDLALIHITSAPGTTERPQDNSCGPYSLEPAIEPLMDLRVDS